ncbi:MAG: hypothetical protein IKQ22_03935 [Clostridia bacterium]|nr:hypothetical protein [Clostridia bacterium]
MEDIENKSEMSAEEKIAQMVDDLAIGLLDTPEEEVASVLDSYDLPEDWKQDVLDTYHELKGAEFMSDEMPHKSMDDLADAQAMADEDDTPVEVSEEDSDGDGDTDKKTTEKTEPEDDSEDTDEKDNSSESEDKPHDEKVTSDVRLKNIHENSTNNIAKTLSNYRW